MIKLPRRSVGNVDVSARMSSIIPTANGPLGVNFGLSRCTSRRSAAGGYADENDAKAEVAVGMSAVGGRERTLLVRSCQDRS